MSKTYYCDHCQKLFKEEDVSRIELNNFLNENIELDLCEKCRTQLEAWVYGGMDVEFKDKK